MACQLRNACFERSKTKIPFPLFKIFDLLLKTITDWIKNHSLILCDFSPNFFPKGIESDPTFYVYCLNRTRVLFTIVLIRLRDWFKNTISILYPKNLDFVHVFQSGIGCDPTFYFKFISIVPIECLYCSNKTFLSDAIGQKITLRSVLRDSQKHTIIFSVYRYGSQYCDFKRTGY